MNAKSDIRFTRCMPVWSIRPQRTVKEFTVFNADNGRIKLKLIFILEYLMNVCKSNAKMKLISPHAIFVPVQRSRMDRSSNHRSKCLIPRGRNAKKSFINNFTNQTQQFFPWTLESNLLH